MCEASGLSAKINLGDIPIYDGVEYLLKQGVKSSLHEENQKIKNKIVFDDSGSANILFDPQTSGGLLASVSPQDSDIVLRKLRAEGFSPRIIGSFFDGKSHIKVI